MTSLKGQTILVIGGSSGLGYGVAKLSLLYDAARVIIASSSKVKVDKAVTRLIGDVGMSAQSRVSGEVVDARSGKDIRALMARVGEIDHLVYSSSDPLTMTFDVDLEAHRNVFDIRFWGALEAAKAAKFKEGGSIVLTMGQAYRQPPKGWTLSAASLGALDSATRGMAIDLAPVRVNAVSPGVVKTELWDIMDSATREGFYAAEAEKLLVKHVADADEVAESYIFLMKCKYVTGQCIEVDGGHVLV